MRFKFLALYLILIFTMFFNLPSLAFAVSSSSILVSIIPENPAPQENVTVSLSSYGSNLDSVPISWSQNGKSVSSQIGQKSFSTMAPAAGIENVIIATINLPDGVIEKRIVLKPSVMTLLWQANDSYVPPFYRGKALPTLDSEIKVVAIPEIKIGSAFVNSQNLTYAWKKDYANMQGDSGYGKNYFLYTNDYLENSNNVSVTASTLDQKYSSQASIDVGSVEPKILFYKNDSTLGILWDNAFTDSEKIEGSSILTAIPYFISPKELWHPSLVWNWFINDVRVNISGLRKNSIPLQTEAGVSGTSRLKLEIENQDKIFQTTSKEINLAF